MEGACLTGAGLTSSPGFSVPLHRMSCYFIWQCSPRVQERERGGSRGRGWARGVMGTCPPCLPQALVLKPPELLRNRASLQERHEKDPSRKEFMPKSLSWERRWVSQSPNQDFLLGKDGKEKKAGGSAAPRRGLCGTVRPLGTRWSNAPPSEPRKDRGPATPSTGGFSQGPHGFWTHS